MRHVVLRWWSRRGEMHLSIAAFSVALIGIVWAIFIVENHTERREAIATAVKQNSNLAVAYEEHVSRTVKGLDAVLRFVRREYARHGPGMNLGQYIAETATDQKLFTILSVVDEHGDIVLSTQHVPPVNYADREHFRFHSHRDADDLYISKPVFGRVSSTWQIPMTRRITRPDGSFGGIVVVSVDPGYFTSFYQKAELGEQGLVALVGLDGTARARRVGQVVSFGNDMSHSRLLKAYLGESVGSFFEPGGYENVARYISYRTVAGLPLVVAVGAAEHEVLAEVRRNRNRDYAIATVMSAAILAFAMLLTAALRRQKRATAALAVSEARLRATFEQATIGIAHISLQGRYVAVNRRLCDMFGYTRDELLGADATAIPRCEALDAEARMRELLEGRIEAYSAPKRYLRRDGAAIWGNGTLTVVRDSEGGPMYFLCVVEDITERRRLEAELRELATTDMLTGLPNRRHFVARLEEEQARLQRFDLECAALLLLDLDHFKRVNDTYGHATGDAVLREFATLIRNGTRKIDVAARIGGEEFAIILPGATRAAALTFAERLRDKVEGAPMTHEGREVRITVSIGVTAMKADDEHAGAALVRADTALYRAKQSGRNCATVDA